VIYKTIQCRIIVGKCVRFYVVTWKVTFQDYKTLQCVKWNIVVIISEECKASIFRVRLVRPQSWRPCFSEMSLLLTRWHGITSKKTWNLSGRVCLLHNLVISKLVSNVGWCSNLVVFSQQYLHLNNTQCNLSESFNSRYSCCPWYFLCCSHCNWLICMSCYLLLTP